jgi:hypothetical protein
VSTGDSTIYDVAVRGNRLYAGPENGLHVFDISDPCRPLEIEQRPHLRVDHEAGPAYLYYYGVARPEYAIRVLFNRATSGPPVVSVFGQLDDAVLVGDRVYLARHEEGFWSYRVPAS